MIAPSLSTSRCLLVLLLLLAVVFGVSGATAAQVLAGPGTSVHAAAGECHADAVVGERDASEPAPPGIWDADLASTDNAADPQECALPLADMRQASPVPSDAAGHERAPVPSLILSRLDRPPRLG
ncbi:MAG: hypothetical protein ACT6S0_05905 [Roseateles sp.]|uniref:hypothetical protein n=1 Tax=Roseateles sp. TaxID=1971397 RepID=UPI0040351DBD